LVGSNGVGGFAIANPDVAPYGRAAEAVLRKRGLWEPLRPHLVLGDSISQAAQRLLLGECKLVLAGGMENMTQAPFVIRGLRNGLKLGGGALEDSLMAGLTDSYCGLPMALTAEKLAEKYGITRKDADTYALRSQQAAAAAYQACRMKEELVAVEVKQGKKAVVVSEDDHLRPDTTMEILEKLQPSFKKDGIVTAGNASGIVDGAAAVVVTREKTAKERACGPSDECFLGNDRCRSEHYGDWAGAEFAAGAESGGPEHRRNGPSGGKRSVCRAISRG
jgi:hypothetical protein